MAKEKEVNITTLGYALLGLLARSEQTGYELSQGFKDPVSFFWHAQHSQIYPELARLESLRLVKYKRVEQTERPDKKIYSLTALGKKHLEAWLTAPLEVPKVRDELVLKAYSLWLVNPKAALQMMRDHEKAHGERLAEYERRLELLKRKTGKQISLESPWFGIQAVLMRGIGYEREYLAWCKWMLEQLEKSLSKPV
jgi:PadR family transcriptional regulator, regulatory protein AphA